MFVKGQSGNPNGRPLGSKNTFSLDVLENALEEVSLDKKVNIFKHFIERALLSDSVLIALMKKVLPDKAEPLIENNNQVINIQQSDKNALINFDPEEIDRRRKEIKDLQARIFKDLNESKIEYHQTPEILTAKNRLEEEIGKEIYEQKQFVMSLIKPEMTKDDVLGVVGYPTLLDEKEGLDIWFYKEMGDSKKEVSDVWVVFQSGKCLNVRTWGIV